MSDKLGLHMNTPPADPSAPRPPRLLDQLRDRIRLKHYSLRTERVDAQWVKRYIYFHGRRHPAAVGQGGGRGEEDAADRLSTYINIKELGETGGGARAAISASSSVSSSDVTISLDGTFCS